MADEEHDKAASRSGSAPLSEGLGLVPEPASVRVHWQEADGGWHQWHDEFDPLPDTWDDRPPDEVVKFYSADQMRAYALRERAAERERCAKLCDDYAKRGGLTTAEEVTAKRLADILRA